MRYLMVIRLAAKCLRSDRERELGEGRRQLMWRVGIQAEFVVAAAEILHERMSCTNHSC